MTLRQNEFCECFTATGNAAEAARRAGYSPRTARAQGHRLLKDSRVQTRVRALHTALADKIDPGLILGRLENLYRLAEQAGGYRAAARILELMGRFVGLDRRGMALGLLSANAAPATPPRPAVRRETPYRLPSAVEAMARAMTQDVPD
ncbi:MAG: terminase small subunit [Rhodospirillales bacterium]|nr:terminase small subunit [Rhodospirillales bacterium]